MATWETHGPKPAGYSILPSSLWEAGREPAFCLQPIFPPAALCPQWLCPILFFSSLYVLQGCPCPPPRAMCERECQGEGLIHVLMNSPTEDPVEALLLQLL